MDVVFVDKALNVALLVSVTTMIGWVVASLMKHHT